VNFPSTLISAHAILVDEGRLQMPARRHGVRQGEATLFWRSQLSAEVKTVLETGVVLALYTVAVIAWREHWTPEKGMSESAAFMPFVGHINAAFFSDFLWLEYLVAVVPFVSVLSGVLTSAFDFLQRPQQLKKGLPLKSGYR
jgi:hypothetical protein